MKDLIPQMLSVDIDLRWSADDVFNYFGLIDNVELVVPMSTPIFIPFPPTPSQYDTSYICEQKIVSFGDANKF